MQLTKSKAYSFEILLLLVDMNSYQWFIICLFATFCTCAHCFWNNYGEDQIVIVLIT